MIIYSRPSTEKQAGNGIKGMNMAIRDAIPIEDGDKTNRKKDTQEPILENSMMSIEVKARTKNVYDINEELIKNNVFYPTITSLQVYHYLLIIFLPVKLFFIQKYTLVSHSSSVAEKSGYLQGSCADFRSMKI